MKLVKEAQIHKIVCSKFSYPEEFQDVVRKTELNHVTKTSDFKHCVCVTTGFSQMTAMVWSWECLLVSFTEGGFETWNCVVCRNCSAP